jgi:hypothetical protein
VHKRADIRGDEVQLAEQLPVIWNLNVHLIDNPVMALFRIANQLPGG